MPFHQPFREKVAHDDLIYGLDDARIKYTKGTDKPFLNGPFSLVDLCRRVYKPRPHTIDEYVVQGEREARFRTAAAAEEVLIRDEFMKMKTRRSYQNSFTLYLERHKKYHTITLKEHPHEGRLFTRKCKGGLAWATTCNDAIIKNMHVHFILDKIDMEYIVHKRRHPNSRNPTDITAHELRWIYRNRHLLRVQQKIQFWLNGKPTTPPWESREGEALWNQYIPQNEPF
ncbi:hypothetical protein [Xenorhabdus taiwanensis]|uniref:Uncharacterized protein n=1 Tax=Xenorhabdus taiwanensis TaxID=3085177 RepID=A0ABM8JYA4_9GAMM|nr:hypothetical protein TCT1_23290 [Xenorhabdus sp. TCT-1]